MLYENYQNKVQRLSKILAKVVKYMVLIIVVAVLTVSAVTALLATWGLPSSVDCTEAMLYGEAVDCRANAFLSKVRYEYSDMSGEVWSEEIPTRPGTYQVRAVGRSFFGNNRYSKPSAFTIAPRSIQIHVAEDTLVFGQVPTVTYTALCDGDELVCNSFVYDDITAATTEVTPNIADIQILDKNGADVTAYYSIEPVTTELTFQKRPLKVIVANSTNTYNGSAFFYDQYEIAEGFTLGADDTLTSVFSATQTDVGEINNSPELTVYHWQDGVAVNVTNQYEIDITVGKLIVEKCPLYIYTGRYTHTYDGNEVFCRDYVLSYDLGIGNNIDIPTVSVALPEGHYLEIIKSTTATDVGYYDNVFVVKIFDGDDRDVTDNYAIHQYYRSLTIDPRPYSFEINGGEWVYDGQSHSYTSFTVDNLVADHKPSFSENSITDVGLIEAIDTTAPICILSGDKDVTSNYTLSYCHIGLLEVTPRPITIQTDSAEKEYDGTALTCPEYKITSELDIVGGQKLVPLQFATVTNVYDPSDNIMVYDIVEGEVSQLHNYDITEQWGALTITPRSAGVYIPSKSFVYDGQPHTYLETEYEISGLLAEHEPLFNYESITDVGTIDAVELPMVIYSNGDDVTRNYDISYNCGTLTVTKRPAGVYIPSKSFVYDGQPHTYLETEYEINGLLAEHEPFFNYESITDVGTIDAAELPMVIYSNGDDVTQNYDISYNCGTLTVTKRPADVYIPSKSFVYDGQPHTYLETEYEISGLLAEHEPLFNYESITDVGTIDAVELPMVIYSNGEDVTRNYDITYDCGTLTVTKRPVTIQIGSDEWVYDGQYHSCQEWDYTEDSVYELVNGQELVVDAFSEICNAGIIDNEFTAYHITDGKTDTTENYAITLRNGTLEIIRRYIIVCPESTEKEYDRTPLSIGNTSVTEDTPYPLVDGHLIVILGEAERTDVGTTEVRWNDDYLDGDNEIIITTESGDDVSLNYFIECRTGTITIHPIKITITSGSASKLYDGTPLTCDEYFITGNLLDGDDPDVWVTGSLTNVDMIDNEFTAKIYAGNNVVSEGDNAYYELELKYGTLTVYCTLGTITSNKGGTIYLRQQSYGNYNGSTDWNVAEEYGSTLPNDISYNYLTSLALGNYGASFYELKFEGLILPMLPYYMGLNNGYTWETSDVYYSKNTGDFTMMYYDMSGIDLSALQGQLGEHSVYEKEYRSFVYDKYLQSRSETDAYMRAIIAEQGFSKSDPDIISKVAAYIQSAATYNLSYDRALDDTDDVAIAFLCDYKEGVCRHYATAATMLYRALGIPARYVTGYAISTEKDVPTEIKTPGHAWVEVYVDGIGWIPVEVTGGGGSDSSIDGASGIITGSEIIDIGDDTEDESGDGEGNGNGDENGNGNGDGNGNGNGDGTGDGNDEGNGDGSGGENGGGNGGGNGNGGESGNGGGNGNGGESEQPKETVEILLYNLQKYYDGSPLFYEEGDYKVTGPDGMEVILNISLTDVGHYCLADLNRNPQDFVTLFYKGTNVTWDYEIVFTGFKGDAPDIIPIQVDRRKIEITTATQTKYDDGEPLTNSGVTITKGSLASGHSLIAEVVGCIVGEGWVENELYELNILDADGCNVTSFYDIDVVLGTLTILPQPTE